MEINSQNNGEVILRRMFHRCVLQNYLGAMTLMINTAADGMIISHFLGGQAAAAFGLVFPIYSLLNFFPVLLRTSAQVNLGKYIGRGDLNSADRCIFYLLSSGLIAAVPLVLLLTALRSPALVMLSGHADYAERTLSLASDYLLWLAPAVFPMMLCPVLHPVMQMDGDVKRSPFAIQIATLINLSGDMMNALLFHGGMAGMALATTLSCYGELFVLVLHFRNSKTVLRPAAGDWRSMKQLMQLSEGFPMMLREIFSFLCGVLLNRLASRLGGENAVAVLAIGSSVWVFLLPAVMAVSGTCMTLGSVSAGEADSRALQTVFRLGVWYSFLPCAAYAFLFFAASKPLTIFCSGGDMQLFRMALPYLRALAMSLPFVCFCQMTEAQLIVHGKARRSSIFGILDGGTIALAFSWILSRFIGQSSLWYGRLAGTILLGLLALLFCFRLTSTGSERRGLFSPRPEEDTDDSLEATLYTTEEITAFSEKLRTSFRVKGLSFRTSNIAALCVEELACNTLQWGYASMVNSGMDVRAVYRNSEVILRFRDGGRPFNPEQYVRQFQSSSQDPSKNIGLRIVSGAASDMRYIPLVDHNIVLLRIPSEC